MNCDNLDYKVKAKNSRRKKDYKKNEDYLKMLAH